MTKLVTQFYNQIQVKFNNAHKKYIQYSLCQHVKKQKTDGSNHLFFHPYQINEFNCENNKKKRKFFLKHLQAHKPKGRNKYKASCIDNIIFFLLFLPSIFHFVVMFSKDMFFFFFISDASSHSNEAGR